MKRKKWTKAALAFSACLFMLWWALGTGATLAWFSDTDMVRNEFHLGIMKLDVAYRNSGMDKYESLLGATAAFDDKALYEPGYTQVVYLQVDNIGTVDFRYKVAVTVEDHVDGKDAWGKKIYLPDYLCYGVVFAESEAALQAAVQTRLDSRNHATETWGALGTWSKVSPYEVKADGDPNYVALIVYMPEAVGNEANYRGIDVPQVKLGITVFAQQANAPLN